MRKYALLSVMALGCLYSCGGNAPASKGDSFSSEEGQKSYDLVAAGKLMAYGMMVDIRMTPEDYVGAKIRVGGNYDYALDEDTGDVYHSVAVTDVTGCCAEFMQFALGEGKVPDVGQYFIVAGTFEPYDFHGQTKYHLVDAVGSLN